MRADTREPAAAEGAAAPFDAIAAGRTDRRRGEGAAMAQATFRDPVGLADESAALQLEVARTLVNAPTLPVALPAFDLTLLSVAAEKHCIHLVLGKSAPIAKLRLERATAGTAI